jgi:hypothetical protein
MNPFDFTQSSQLDVIWPILRSSISNYSSIPNSAPVASAQTSSSSSLCDSFSSKPSIAFGGSPASLPSQSISPTVPSIWSPFPERLSYYSSLSPAQFLQECLSCFSAIFSSNYQAVFGNIEKESEKGKKDGEKVAKTALKIIKSSYVTVVASHMTKIAIAAQEKV